MKATRNVLLVLLCLLSWARAQESDSKKSEWITSKWVPVLKELYEKGNELKDAWGYVQYVEGLGEDIRAGKEPRKPPISIRNGDDLIKGIAGTTARIRAVKPLELPEEVAQFKIPDLLQGKVTDRAKALQAAAEYLAHNTAHVDALDAQLKVLQSYQERTRAVWEASKVTSDQLKKVLEGPLTHELYNLIGLAWLDLEAQILPAVTGLESEVKSKQKEIEKFRDLRRQEVGNLRANLRSILDVLKDELKKEHEDLLKKAEDLSADEKKVSDEIEPFNQNGSKLKERQDALSARQDNLKGIQDRFNGRVEGYNKEVDALKKLRLEINGLRFTYCPNGADFEKCDHEDLKTRWVNEKNGKINGYNNRQKALEKLGLEIEAESKTLNGDVEAFSRDYRQFEADADAHRKKSDAIDKEVQRLKDLEQELRNSFAAVVEAISALHGIQSYLE